MRNYKGADSLQIFYEKCDLLSAEKSPFLFVISYEQDEAIIVEDPLEKESLLFAVNDKTNAPAIKKQTNDNPILVANPIPYREYLDKYQTIEKALRRGDSFLCNLTVATPIELSCPLSDLFYLVNAPYKLYIPGRFLCFSPEKFVTIDSRTKKIYTYPMKGTIDASIPHAKEMILSDYKETAEHYTIVDLMRADLARVATHVSVERFRYIDRIETPSSSLLQVSSLISGYLKEGPLSIGSILRELLPAGSISGAPKSATIEAIASAEKGPRGFYTGIFGFYDGENLDSCVLIRFIEETHDHKYLYRSGGGITINSSPQEEYNEIIQKVYLPIKRKL